VAMLIELMGRSSVIFADVLQRALSRLVSQMPGSAGPVYRFEQG
jgi:hypothetical protein